MKQKIYHYKNVYQIENWKCSSSGDISNYDLVEMNDLTLLVNDQVSCLH